MTSPTGGGLRKVRRGTFVQVPSATIRDAGLSFRARGVLAFLLDHPDGWKVDAAAIAREGREGREAVEVALRELRAAGYYRLERRRLPGGAFAMGTAIAEERVDEWAAAHAAHDGRAITVRVDADGTVTELAPTDSDDTDTDTGNGFSGPGVPGSGDDAPGDPAANYSDSETDSEEGGDLAGDVTSATSPSLKPPLATCTQEHAAGAACGACRADRLARELWQATTDAAAQRARSAARIAELEAREADRRAAVAEVTACRHCDAEGTAVVDGVRLRCQHDADRNDRAAQARNEARAALDAARRRTTTVNTDTTPEA